VSFVPNASNAFIDPPKLTYLLVTNQGKAKFFRLFGFNPNRPLGVPRTTESVLRAVAEHDRPDASRSHSAVLPPLSERGSPSQSQYQWAGREMHEYHDALVFAP
jgi:hypothetical protein